MPANGRKSLDVAIMSNLRPVLSSTLPKKRKGTKLRKWAGVVGFIEVDGMRGDGDVGTFGKIGSV